MISIELAKKPFVISYLRFSRPEQMSGDSLRRQIAASEKWAADRGLTLAPPMRDESVSAFRGKNAVEGKLSRFLELVRGGRIPKGSTLLIEALDRLSRDEVTEALELFLSIIRNGIRIVTLMDGCEFTKESVNQNPTSLMYSIMVMSSSHGESAKKSQRVAEAWAEKRKQARERGTPLTSRLPSWLEKGSSGKITLVADRAKIVREIYRMTAEGHGIVAVQRRLNAKYTGIRAKHISRTHIHDILTSRAVLGEFQPSKMATVNGRQVRVPDGDPIAGFFPAVISQDLYYKAQASRKPRQRTGGPNTKFVNLFAGKLYAEDGSRLIIQSKRQRVYVSADAVNAAPGAAGFHCVPVRCFEVALIARLAEPEMHHAVQVEDDVDEQLESLLEAKGKVDRQVEDLTKQALAGSMSPSVVSVMNMLDLRRAQLGEQIEDVKTIKAARSAGAPNLLLGIVDRLGDLMVGGLSDEDRTKLKNAVAQFVERIDCQVRKHGRWFEVGANAKLVSGRETFVHFFCKTLATDKAWFIYLKHDIGYHAYRNDTGDVQSAWRPSVPKELSHFSHAW